MAITSSDGMCSPHLQSFAPLLSFILVAGLLPKTFSLFSLLPTEVRLKIWRATFPPGRRISLAIFHSKPQKNIQQPHPPTSLFANQESRNETLRYYNVVCYDIDQLHRFTFISPQKDVLVIDGDVAFHRVQLQQARVSAEELNEHLSASLGIFRTLELRNLNWPVVFINPSPGYEHQRPSIWWVISQFQGLHTIEFVMPYALLDVYCEPCKVVVEAFLDEHKEKYDGGIQPKIKFIPFAKRQLLES